MERRSRHLITHHALASWLLLLLVGGAGCSSDVAEETAAPLTTGQTLHPDITITPDGLGTLETGQNDALGRPLAIPCSTCHNPKDQAPMRTQTDQLGEVHKGLAFDHGELRCGSCHDAEDRDRLKLADGRTIPFAQVMDLCGQCHGSQLRDYKKGAHGGMQGYWDRTRGPRTRNNCVVCHDAHTPAIPQVMPAPGPRDRFLSPEHDASPQRAKNHE